MKFKSKVPVSSFVVSICLGVAVSLMLSITVNAQDDLCFPPHKGLPFDYLPPKIDGFIEPDLGVGTDKAAYETGWAHSTRLTYIGEAGLPQVVYQGLRHNTDDYIYLSFLVRFDRRFDEDDRIILVFRPDYSTGSTTQTGDERRIDIRPLWDGGGAGDPINPDDTTNPDGSPLTTNPYKIRSNHGPLDDNYYEWDTTSSGWVSITKPSNVDIKVRSWDLGTNNKNWSVEIKLPTTTALGGGDWIDFTSNFGFYFNVIRVCNACPSVGVGGIPGDIVLEGLYFSSQFTWPRADYSTYDRILQDPISGPIGILQHEIPPNWLGEAILSSGPSDCQGVKFTDSWNGIGVQNPSNPTGPLTSSIDGFAVNTFAARVQNDSTTTDAEDVNATFRIANWGLGPGTPELWTKIRATNFTTNPAPDHTINASTTLYEFTMKWQLDATERTQWASNPQKNDQCIWVLLNSDKDVNFVESSIRRNMSFVGLSSYERDAEISGKGYRAPEGGTENHGFLLVLSHRYLVSTKEYDEWRPRGYGQNYETAMLTRDRERKGKVIDWLSRSIFNKWKDQDRTVYNWVMITNGFRRTGAALTIGEKTFRIYQPVGSFGYSADHKGEAPKWKSSITGQGLHKLSENTYYLPVANNGAATINTKLQAIEPRFAISLRGGFAVPHRDLDIIYDPGFGLNAGFEILLGRYWSIEAIAGYHHFADGGLGNDLDILQFSGNLRFFYPFSSKLRPFLNAGAGLYKMKPGDSEFGFNGGAGFDLYLTNQWALEFAYNYHKLPDQIEFSTLQLGFRVRF